jgi:membrane-bound metal-dependent hydrolase YbcI (DUF457 family)
MDPATHTLAALALARAGAARATRLALPIVLVAGAAADLDLVSRLGGAEEWTAWRRAATHSLLGTVVIAALVASVFWFFGRRHAARPVRLLPAFLVSLAAAGLHLLLDLTNSHGAQLLWPFRDRWFAWDLLEPIDPLLLALLLAGLLLPALFRLVSEEIGARREREGISRGAAVALALVALYVGGRWIAHGRAHERLANRLYQGERPVAVGVFPAGASPLVWRGVVETELTLAEIDVNVSAGFFDPGRARTHYKPQQSPLLDAALGTEVAKRYLRFARFPAVTIVRLLEGHRVEIRDARFAPTRTRPAPVVHIVLDAERRVVSAEILFSTGR